MHFLYRIIMPLFHRLWKHSSFSGQIVHYKKLFFPQTPSVCQKPWLVLIYKFHRTLLNNRILLSKSSQLSIISFFIIYFQIWRYHLPRRGTYSHALPPNFGCQLVGGFSFGPSFYFLKDVVTSLTPEIAQDSIYAYLEKELRISIVTSKRMMTVEKMTEIDEKYLALGDYNCLAVVSSQTYNSDGIMFEYTQSRHRPDYFCFRDNATRHASQNI